MEGELFTRQRVIFGGVLSFVLTIAGIFGTIFVAKIQAGTTAKDALNDFKVKVTEEVGAVKGDVQTLQSLNMDINRRLENIEGDLNTITSYILKK